MDEREKLIELLSTKIHPMEGDFPWISSDSDGFCHRGERKENA